MGRVLGGWETALLGFWQTGIPFTVVDGSPAINLPGITSDRPNQTHAAALPSPSINKWFDTTAFVRQTLGTPGNEASDSVYGPRLRSVDMSLLKDIAFNEQMKFQFRAEFFNVLNVPNFGPPASGMTTPQFGVISSTAGNMTPRQMQFALKFLF